jgi:hypothetical protein
MEYVFLIFFAVLTGLYLADRKGWNATAKRLTNIVRANIEASKPIKQLESSSKKVIEQKSKDKWTADFTGKPIDNGKKHEIVRTWYARVGGTVYPHFKCKCGHADFHVTVDAAVRSSKKHVSEMNHAEELLERNGGTHAW